MLHALKPFSKSNRNGMFINSCYAHCQSQFQLTWYADNSTIIGNKVSQQRSINHRKCHHISFFKSSTVSNVLCDQCFCRQLRNLSEIGISTAQKLRWSIKVATIWFRNEQVLSNISFAVHGHHIKLSLFSMLLNERIQITQIMTL